MSRTGRQGTSHSILTAAIIKTLHRQISCDICKLNSNKKIYIHKNAHLFPITLVVQVEQSVWCVCLYVCLDNNFRTK